MLAFFRTPTPPIGLELGADSFKLIQITQSAGRLKVSAAFQARVPENVKGDPDRRVHFVGEQLKLALKSGGFVGNRIVAALPKELCHYKTHRLPPIAPEEVAAAARIDARDLFRFDPDSADVQWLDAGEIRPEGGERRREVILIAVGKKYIYEYTLALDAAGAEVVSLDIDPCAVWRAAKRVPPPPNADAIPDPRVLVDLGAAHSRVIIGLEDVIRVVKTIDATARSADVLAREVLRCIRYYAATFDGLAPKRIELVGGAANDLKVRSAIASTLHLPVEPADLFAHIDMAAMPRPDPAPGEDRRMTSLGEWAVALGLALKGARIGLTLSVAKERRPLGAVPATGGRS